MTSDARVPCHLAVDAGRNTGLVEAADGRMTVRFENAIVTVHGTKEDRRELVRELAEALGLRLEPEGALAAVGAGRCLRNRGR